MTKENVISEIKVKIENIAKFFSFRTGKDFDKKDYNDLRKTLTWLEGWSEHLNVYAHIYLNIPPEARSMGAKAYWDGLRAIGEFQFPEQLRLNKAKETFMATFNERPDYVKGVVVRDANNRKAVNTEVE